MNRLTWLLFLLLMAALGGCASSTTAAGEAVETTDVSMPRSYRFDPVAIRVVAGSTVTWTNRDNFSHSVRVVDTEQPFLDLEPGESGSLTFTEAGEYLYICTYHAQDMKGTVIVTEP